MKITMSKRNRILAVAAFVAALAGCGSAATQPHARPAPTVTVTRTVTQTVKVRVPGPTVTVKVPEPGPTVTINGDSAQLQADNTCIAALYQNIQGWKASGWWDSRCPIP
jgi:ABC-type uncharacterized transport system auxiliary subunit